MSAPHALLGTHRHPWRSPRKWALPRILGLLDRLYQRVTGSVADAEVTRCRARAIEPVVWLLGKTGAGKTAIVAAARAILARRSEKTLL
jgi:flagellar biosynthesis GTPase FlhF